MINLETDVLASHKYFNVYRQTKPAEPERRLMFAVLVEAVQTYQKFACSTTVRGQALFCEAETWFWDQDYEGVFSFSNICEVFELDPALFRRGLLKWRVNRKLRGSPAKITQLRSPANRSLKPMFSTLNRASCITFERRRRDV